MSSSDDDDYPMETSHASLAPEVKEPDSDTMRILISTDNHIGYLEQDPVRGMDSFAAFEEVLYLARKNKVDFVLLGGDLFHHNKPSRRTLYKTMEIIRRYTMGTNAVKIQILSDQQRDFRNLHGAVNYEDQHYSVDMPIFSIHGNHDDPTRDGGNEMLAALDLLSVSNLVNYFGRQEEVNKVEVSPVLIQKGKTRLAMYGMGNMRDERLNRMWQQKKVRFLRPDGADKFDEGDMDVDEEGNYAWFNLFVLHQNRDNMGRGNKNCIHETMIPQWVDLTVFGHEHCSEPYPDDSVVGTFRIVQPGSSVATSLTAGEAARKHVCLFNLRGSQFRLDPIPLTMVRSFVMNDVVLNEQEFSEDDVNIDAKITKILEEDLRLCIYNARAQDKQLLEDARKEGNDTAESDSHVKYRLEKRDQVLVRLRVEHSDFHTLNNQRFGAKFVGQVANPTDILLFQRAKKARKPSASKKKSQQALEDPVAPIELQSISVPNLVKENLEEADQKLTLLTESAISEAIHLFVDKSETNAIMDTTTSLLKKHQNRLLKQKDAKGDGHEISTAKDVRNALERSREEDEAEEEEDRPCKKSVASKRKRDSLSDDDDDDDLTAMRDKENDIRSKGTNSQAKTKNSRASVASSKASQSVEILSSDEEVYNTKKRNISKGKASKAVASKARKNSGDIRSFTVKRSSLSQSQRSTTSRRPKCADSEEEDDEDEVEIVSTKRPSQRRRTAKGRVNYSVDDSENDDDDDFVNNDEEESDDDVIEDGWPSKNGFRGGRRAGTSARGDPGRGRRAPKSQDSSVDFDEDWGSACTRSQR